MVHRRGDCFAMSAGFSGTSNWVDIDSTVGVIRELASNMPIGKKKPTKRKVLFYSIQKFEEAETRRKKC